MKIRQKTILLHGLIVCISLVASYFYFPLVGLPVLGYCFWGIARVVAHVIRDIRPWHGKVLVGGILTVALLQAAMIIVALPLWFSLVCYSHAHPDYGESLPEYKWRGQILHNASYFQTYSITLLEGEISQEQFLLMAEKAHWKLSEISAPQRISQRARAQIRRFEGCPEDPENDEMLTIKSGIKANYIQSNGGGYHVWFDRESSRLYYLSTPR